MWQCGDFEFDTRNPVIMGILNVTPDSFSDGGLCYAKPDVACAYARQMLKDGAAIIDVGGESTRPGSEEITINEELARVLPVVSALAQEGVAVSIDTRHAEVAAACVKQGACVINDVTGFSQFDMREVARQSKVGCIISHMQGVPKTMQTAPQYDDVVEEVESYLLFQASLLESQGVASARIAIDPGPGFGKTFEHNLALLCATSRLASHGYPVMASWSRKRFVGDLTGETLPHKRVAGSVEIARYAASQGARILRVHDVSATAKALGTHPSRPARYSKAFIALGSNAKSEFGDPAATLKAAAQHIGLLEGVCFVRLSSLYTSEPAYQKNQALFTNAALEIRTTLSAAELLEKLLDTEQKFGRKRSPADAPNGPRTLDCDLLDYEGFVCATPALTLPHPRLLERDFVVTPLLEIAPGHILADGSPVTRERVSCGAVLAGDRAADSRALFSVCSTPIGNLGDVTLRVLETLGAADIIYAEDTRVTRKLLARHDIHTSLERCDEYAAERKLPQILSHLEAGERIAYVTDAGMPGVSDPGLKLVGEVRAAGYTVEVLPGASAAVTAFVASGFDARGFYFGGFLPRTETARVSCLEKLAFLPDTALVFYESPHRVVASLKAIAQVFFAREVCVARELTKIHEEILFGSADELLGILEKRIETQGSIKGEVTLVIAPEANAKSPQANAEPAHDDAKSIQFRAAELRAQKTLQRSHIAKMLADEFNITRSAAYEIAKRL